MLFAGRVMTVAGGQAHRPLVKSLQFALSRGERKSVKIVRRAQRPTVGEVHFHAFAGAERHLLRERFGLTVPHDLGLHQVRELAAHRQAAAC